MRFQKILRSALVLAAGFLLCVLGRFGFGIILILVGLFMFCTVPSASQNKQAAKAPVRKSAGSAGKSSSISKNSSSASGAPACDAYHYSGSVERYFSELLQGCFPECTVRENVSPASLRRGSGAASWECRCGTANTGKFCSECGKPRPGAAGLFNVAQDAVNLSFVLYRNGAPAAAIILCSKYEWDSVAIHLAMDACKQANIPCLRFYEQFRNDAGYVTQRIRSVLR